MKKEIDLDGRKVDLYEFAIVLPRFDEEDKEMDFWKGIESVAVLFKQCSQREREL